MFERLSRFREKSGKKMDQKQKAKDGILYQMQIQTSPKPFWYNADD
jgi:hypothetical protein